MRSLLSEFEVEAAGHNAPSQLGPSQSKPSKVSFDQAVLSRHLNISGREWLLFIVLLLIGRIALSTVLPLMDFSEARYAEMGRKMLEYNDWVTLWFTPEQPFWGKPPAAFWTVAISFFLFGVNEFASRLPSLIATGLTALLIYRWVKSHWQARTATLATTIYLSSLIVVHTAGSVITDPLLTFATTLVMVSFWDAVNSERAEDSKRAAYLVWIGLGIGLLAKGPLALVLCGAACGLWVLIFNQWQQWFSRILLWRGLLLMTIIAAPWYYLAELRSPGFFDYFIVGEHYKRFIETAWQGDLYGGVKDQPLGAIWVYFFVALLPWSPIVIIRMFSSSGREIFKQNYTSAPMITAYLLLWALTTLVFFTVAKNILITYVMPVLPACAILIAINFDHWVMPSKYSLRYATGFVVIFFVALFTAYYGHFQYHRYNQKPLVMKYQAMNEVDPGKLVYFGAHRFSPVFYTQERVIFARHPMQHMGDETVYFAVRDMWKSSTTSAPILGRCTEKFDNADFTLWYCPAIK